MRPNTFKVLLLITGFLFLLNDVYPGDPTDLRNISGKGLIILKDQTFSPDESGIFASLKIQLPEYTEGIFFGSDGAGWPAMANRMFQWKFNRDLSDIYNVKIPSYGNVLGKGGFVMLKLKTGKTLMLMCMLGHETMSYFRVHPEGELLVEFGNFGTDTFSGDIPLLAYAISDNYYQAIADALGEIKSYPDRTEHMRLREEKAYPELFNYLGWCTWEQHYHAISEEIILSSMARIKQSEVPIRWLLIDDGHQSLDPELPFGPKNPTMGLKSFKPNAKFPDGWKNIIAAKDDKIKWIGLWHCMNGFWGGIAVNNEFGEEMNSNLIEITRAGYTYKEPAINRFAADLFYGKLLDYHTSQGFDLAKVDVQSSNVARYTGTSNAVKAANFNQQALEKAMEKHSMPLINCMAHQVTNFYNSEFSNVSRVSKDYAKNNMATVKSQIFQAFHNTAWMGQIMWGDHDMFHSSDKKAGAVLALCKAMSGGPVYLSDDPADFVENIIIPLCYDDGRLLRPAAPATVLPGSAFTDPVNQPELYNVIAPYQNRSASILINNIFRDSISISTSITPEDYTHASCMMQPYPGKWDIPSEGLVVYDWAGKALEILEDNKEVTLAGLSNKIFHLCPITKGWAVVGLTSKYMSPASVFDINAKKGKLSFSLEEPGEFAVYLENGKPYANGISFKQGENGLWFGIPDKDTREIQIRKK